MASTTTSTSGAASSFVASSVKRVASIRALSQPTRRQASFARSGARSAITATSMPGVVGTWARNIEPNFPAPISPTRTGLAAATRCCNSRCRFIPVLPFAGEEFVPHC